MTLKEFLQKYNIKPAEFAVRAGIGVSTVWAYLSGDRNCSERIAKKIEKTSGGLVTIAEMREPKKGEANGLRN